VTLFPGPRVEEWWESLDTSPRIVRGFVVLALADVPLLLALFAGSAWIAPVRAFFGLEVGPPAALLALSRGFLLVTAWHHLRRGLGPRAFFVAIVVWCFLEELAAGALVLWAQSPGAFALSALPLLRALFDAITFGAGAGLPHLALAHGLGLLAALALRPGVEHAWLLWLHVPTVVAAFLIASAARERFGRERRLERALRRSIELRAVEQRHAELESANARLLEVLVHRHDARSAVAAAGLRVEPVLAALRPRPEHAATARALEQAFRRLESALVERRSEGPPIESGEVAVAVLPVLRASVEAARRLHPSVELAARGDASVARVAGGEGSLRQILDHLVANACEGDGRRSARAVDVRVEAGALSRALAICVSDDGPGFSTDLRATPLAPFSTTKEGHAGLGLYTVERLVRASRGSLRVENRVGGGARATVYLPSQPS
jgi:signal transduction histidine kinase